MVERLRPHITVVGLGPAGAPFLSHGAVALMANAERTYLRTARHPAAADLEFAASFDDLYEAADSFDEVYAAIVDALVAAATDGAPEPVVFAVPGSPLVAERTVELLRVDARVDVTVIPSLSFLDLAWQRLGIDPLHDGVQLIDGERFAEQVGTSRGPFLVAQCWSQQILSEMKLSAEHDDDAPLPDVILLHHLGLADEEIVTTGWWDLDRTLQPDHLTSVFIPRLSAAVAVEREMTRLSDLMLTLRAQCPWDQVQTHGSLMPHLVEETYEVLDALSAIDASQTANAALDPALFDDLEEELGDLLFQVVFHACLAEEEGQFTLADVAKGIHDKLVHRHPHVFGTTEVESPEQVVTNWEAIKKKEKSRTSVTDGIPSSLPALMLASKLQRKAQSVGIDPTAPSGTDQEPTMLLEDLHRRAGAHDVPGPDAPLGAGSGDVSALVGDLLFEVANLARQVGVDPEHALRARAMALRDAIRASEGVHNPAEGNR